jgi:hypothetical protein
VSPGRADAGFDGELPGGDGTGGRRLTGIDVCAKQTNSTLDNVQEDVSLALPTQEILTYSLLEEPNQQSLM